MTTQDTPLLDKEKPEEEVDVVEEETGTLRTTRKAPKEDLLDNPEAVVDAVKVTAEENPVSPERETTSAVTAMLKVISPETAPNLRRSVHPDVKVPAEEEVENVENVPLKKMITSAATAMLKVTSPEIAPSPKRSVHPDLKVPEEAEEVTVPPKKETTSAVTAKPKVTSPEIVPNPKRSALRDPNAPSLPVPPLVRLAATAMLKAISPETALSPRRKELPVKIDPLESLDHAITAVKKDILPETAPSLRKNLRQPKEVKRKRESPEPPLKMTVLMIKTVSTVKTTPLGKPAELRRRLTLFSKLMSLLRSLRKLALLNQRTVPPPSSSP